MKQKLLLLKGDVCNLHSMLEDERKRYRERVPLLEARIRQLEMMLVDHKELETALRTAKNRLRACEFYKVITAGKDENVIDRFVREDARVDVGQFVIMLRRQLDNARKVQKKLSSDLRIERELVLSLREKKKKLKTIVKTLNRKLRDDRITAQIDRSSPVNPKLSSSAFEQSPLKRDSLGINESVDIDTNVLSSALRSRPNGKPIRKRANATRVPKPQVPKSLRERVLKCSDNSRSIGLGGAQGPADMTLANLELRHCTSSKALIKNSVSKRMDNANVVQNQRLSQFFPEMSKDVEVVDLE
ncbi:hypothetical protein KIN20_001915 [Parelaphostrongylus tenuis]|uniref:Uncharacterized protein n=1 Tax=Parelaphostrongylus tenuis TaxID=148309 RepID=A0AAD5MG17_PARTN|nr:hypothetical protein KIN20_001915 [Parelaphostrongylus tenuis]